MRKKQQNLAAVSPCPVTNEKIQWGCRRSFVCVFLWLFVWVVGLVFYGPKQKICCLLIHKIDTVDAMLRVGGKSGFCLVAPNHSLLPSNHSMLPPNDSFSPANNRWISKNKWKIWIGTAENKEIESSFRRACRVVERFALLWLIFRLLRPKCRREISGSIFFLVNESRKSWSGRWS